MTQTVEQEDLGVQAPSSLLSPPRQKTKRVQRKRIFYPHHQDHDHGKRKTRLMWWSAQGPGPSSTSWMARRSTDGQEVVSPDCVPGGTTVEVGESTAGVDSSSRTPKWRTLELAARIGRRPMRVLVDSGSTGNYIDARECTARRIKIEAEDQSEELKMADGTVVKTEGRVQFVLKCGGYRGQISARVFPNMNKPMIWESRGFQRKTPTSTGLRLQW